jgi:hypothetical protein
MTPPVRLADVLGAPVSTAGTRVGFVSGVYADPAGEQVIGLEVVGPTGRQWYLPWATTMLENGGLKAASPLVFMPFDAAGFYVESGVRLDQRDADRITIEAAGLVRADAAEAEAGASREGTVVA